MTTQKPVDVAIPFYGKPYQTITTIQSIIDHCLPHVDKIYLSYEKKQPHDDWSGIYKVIDYFRDSSANIVLHKPAFFLGHGASDRERTATDRKYKNSILYQFALDHTDKKYLCVMHNDMLFTADLIGAMLQEIEGKDNIAGIGHVGQCWNCPAFFAQLCDPTRYEMYKPTFEEALILHENSDAPRKENAIAILKRGFVHPLPECRLNEYCSLINVPLHRKMTLPNGPVGCYGGNWGGSDTAAIWFHQMYNEGYPCIHFDVHTMATHAAFDGSGSGTESYNSRERYYLSEENALAYINSNYSKKAEFSSYVTVNTILDAVKRTGWEVALSAFRSFKRIVKS